MVHFPHHDDPDLLDAMADLAHDQEMAMRETEQSEWDGVEDISIEERYACEHYNERYSYTYRD